MNLTEYVIDASNNEQIREKLRLDTFYSELVPIHNELLNIILKTPSTYEYLSCKEELVKSVNEFNIIIDSTLVSGRKRKDQYYYMEIFLKRTKPIKCGMGDYCLRFFINNNNQPSVDIDYCSYGGLTTHKCLEQLENNIHLAITEKINKDIYLNL